MVKTNLQVLEEIFPNGTFNLSQPVRESEEGDFIDLNPTEEDRFEDEAEEEEGVGKVEKKKRNQKKKNRNNKFQCTLIGDSNFKKSDRFLDGVIYRKATCLNNKESSGGLADALNFVVQLTNIKTIVVSALQNAINDEGILDWKRTVTKYVLMISTAATKRPDAHFIVLGPFLRTQKSNHGPLLKPMLDQLLKEFGPVKNIHVDSRFQVSTNDLQYDGVHLRPRSEARLFEHLTTLFAKDWSVAEPEEQGQSFPRSVVGQQSRFSDLRSLIHARNAPLIPPPSRQTRSRPVERRHSQGEPRFQSHSQQVERRNSHGVCHFQAGQRSFERCYSHGEHHSRSAGCAHSRSRSRSRSHSRSHSRARSRSRSPVIKTIEKLDGYFKKVFGVLPNKDMYFPHRNNNSRSRSASPRSMPDTQRNLLPRRRSIKERLGRR